MKRRVVLAVLALGLFGGALAEAAKVKTERDPKADFTAFHTYRWKTAAGPGPADLDGPIRGAAKAALAERGLREAKEGETADLVLEYNAGLADQLAAGFGVSVDWWGQLVLVPGGDSNVTAGLLFLFTRADDGAAVWSGWLIQRGTSENALLVLRERAPKYARKILASYPRK